MRIVDACAASLASCSWSTTAHRAISQCTSSTRTIGSQSTCNSTTSKLSVMTNWTTYGGRPSLRMDGFTSRSCPEDALKKSRDDSNTITLPFPYQSTTMDPLKQVQPETVNRKVTLKQPLKVTPKSDLLHLEARRCSYTGPTRGHEPRCVSVAGPFNAMQSPVGFRGKKEPASVIHSSTRIQPA